MPDELTREERKKKLEERRLRRRKHLERTLSTQIAAILLTLGLVLSILLLVIPRPKESQLEKRPLATVPPFTLSGFFSGEFTHGITTAYDDTIPFRDSLKNINNSMKTYFGLHSGNTVEIIGNVAKIAIDSANSDDPPVSLAEDPSVQSVSIDSSAAAAPEDDMETASSDTSVTAGTNTAGAKKNYEKEAAEGTLNNSFLIIHQDGHWRGLPLVSGSIDGSGDEYTTFLNTLRSRIDSSIRLYSMPIPLASAYYLPENFSDYSADQRKAFQDIFARTTDAVINIDLIDVLGAHESENIFLRTDHHWSALGAYYGCEALAEAAGLPFLPLSDYHEINRPGYVGSLYGYTSSANLMNDPEVFPLLIPGTSYVTAYHNPDYTFGWQDDLFIRTDISNSYLAFHGGDAMIVHTITGTRNGRKILILKDSFGDPMSCLLTGTFEEIFSVDLRFCTVNLLDLIRDQGITDIVTAMDIDTVLFPIADLQSLLTQRAGLEIPHNELEDMAIPEGPGSPYFAEAVNGNDPLLAE